MTLLASPDMTDKILKPSVMLYRWGIWNVYFYVLVPHSSFDDSSCFIQAMTESQSIDHRCNHNGANRGRSTLLKHPCENTL